MVSFRNILYAIQITFGTIWKYEFFHNKLKVFAQSSQHFYATRCHPSNRNHNPGMSVTSTLTGNMSGVFVERLLKNTNRFAQNISWWTKITSESSSNYDTNLDAWNVGVHGMQSCTGLWQQLKTSFLIYWIANIEQFMPIWSWSVVFPEWWRFPMRRFERFTADDFYECLLHQITPPTARHSYFKQAALKKLRTG